MSKQAVAVLVGNIGLAWLGLAWLGLAWIGLDWIGLDWIGLDWIGLNCSYIFVSQTHHGSIQPAQFSSLRSKFKPFVLVNSVTLPEIYSLFNRSRGLQNMVSPDDLLECCKLLKNLDLGMELRKFKSGVIVVTEAGNSDEEIAKRLKMMAADRYSNLKGDEGLERGISSVDVCNFLGVGQVLAAEYLKSAEEKGVLCYDESIRGTFFYENLFPSFN